MIPASVASNEVPASCPDDVDVLQLDVETPSPRTLPERKQEFSTRVPPLPRPLYETPTSAPVILGVAASNEVPASLDVPASSPEDVDSWHMLTVGVLQLDP